MDYGPDYVSFNAATAGINGGFAKSEPQRTGKVRAADRALLR